VAKAVAVSAEEERRQRLADAQVKVKATLESKRAARLQKEAELAAELKRIRIKNQFLEADKEAVERKKAESQQAGEQREIIERQQRKLEAAQAHLSVYNTEAQQRLKNKQREREAQEAFLREYEAHFAETSELAVVRQGGVEADHAQKLATRREAYDGRFSDREALKATKVLEAASLSTLPSLDKTRVAA